MGAFKNVWVLFLSTLLLSLVQNASASTIEKCLLNNPNQTYFCAKKTIKNLTLNSCYAVITDLKSEHIKEKVKDFCFYQVSEFPSLASCIHKAKLFLIAEDNDNAKLSCITQFQDQLKKVDCLKIANSLKTSEKKWFLQNHCNNL